MADRVPDQRDEGPGVQSTRRNPRLRQESGATDFVGSISVDRRRYAALRWVVVAAHRLRGRRHPSLEGRRNQGRGKAVGLLQDFSVHPLLVREWWLLFVERSDMPLAKIENLPDDSRVWVFGADSDVGDEAAQLLLREVDRF